MSKWEIHTGDAELVAPTLDGLFDAIVCDPPYGLSFMGRGWDRAVPSPDLWRAIASKLRPGAHVFAFGGTRLWHHLALALEEAGFEIRDTVVWLYGSGFPKSHNLDGDHEGYGTALKPAWEPCIVARWPVVGTVAQNAAEHGTGALNIDGARIATDENPSGVRRQYAARESFGATGWTTPARPPSYNEQKPGEMLGRWPANVVLDEEAGAALDAQAGDKGGGFNYRGGSKDSATVTLPATGELVGYGDTGGASRFYYCAKASRAEREAGLDGREAVTGASITGRTLGDKSSKSASGYTGTTEALRRNIHPTVKPIALCEWLATLALPPDVGRPRRVLVPFSGSGSEMIGCLRAGWDEVVGIEMSEEYASIARDRLAHHEAEMRIDRAQLSLF